MLFVLPVGGVALGGRQRQSAKQEATTKGLTGHVADRKVGRLRGLLPVAEILG